MVRPNRAHGRPGTRVIPKDFERDHAVVVDKTKTASITIHAPTDPADLTVTDDFDYTSTAPDAPLYAGTARIQALAGQESRIVTGDQEEVTVQYRVIIDVDAGNIPDKATVTVTSSTDATLHTLIVRKVTRGSIRWERDLYCSDELTREAA